MVAEVRTVPAIAGVETALQVSADRHGRLCPRQVLGVRIGLAGMKALCIEPDGAGRPLLAFVETDGCFVSGVEAATGCSVGHRNLRVQDYGKVAATFVDTRDGRAVRLSPRAGVREIAAWYARDESRRYYQQLEGYQRMPDDELLLTVPVAFSGDLDALMARPGTRVHCDSCGEEVINQREIERGDATLCRACAGDGYYRLVPPAPAGLHLAASGRGVP